MSDAAAQLLTTFESLPANEQHELLIAMLRRSGELPDTLVSDDQLVSIADELFQTLDAEESDGNGQNQRAMASVACSAGF